MPETEGCQSTRFPNVIAKNTVYVGQTKDAPRNRCATKACAERGSPNNPSSGTVEALSLIAKYFVAGESSTIAYLSGTFDGDATAPIVIPPWVSMIGLIAGAAILSSPYGYVLGDTAIADSAVQVRDFRFLQQRIARLRLEYVPYYVKPYLTAAYSVLKGVELILDNLIVNVPGNALCLSTSNDAALKATITGSTFVSSNPGTTAVSFLSAGNSALSATLTGNTTTVFQGTALKFEAQDASSLDFADYQSKKKDIGTEPSPVPFTICKGTGASTLSYSGSDNESAGNTQDGVPLFLTSLGGSCNMVKRCSGSKVTQTGQGVVSSHDIIEHAKMDYSSTNVRMTSNGPRFLQKISSDALQQSSTSNNSFEYTGDEPLSQPTCSIVLSALAKLVKKSTGNNYLVKTAEGVPSYFIDVADGASFSGNSSNLTCENKGPGNGKKFQTLGDQGAILQQSCSNCQAEGNGTLLELQQASSGGLTYNSSQSRWIQTGVSPVPLKLVEAVQGTVSTSSQNDEKQANTPEGMPAFQTRIRGSAVGNVRAENGTNKQMGEGDLYFIKYEDESFCNHSVSNQISRVRNGTLLTEEMNTSGDVVKNMSNNVSEQTEDTTKPLKRFIQSGSGTLTSNVIGSKGVGRTADSSTHQSIQSNGSKILTSSNEQLVNPKGSISSHILSDTASEKRSSLGTTADAPNGAWKSYSLSGSAILQSRDASAQITAKQVLITTATEDATASHTFQGSVLTAVSDDLPAFDLVGKIATRVDSSELQQTGKASLIRSVGADIALSGSTLGRANDDLSETSLIDTNGGSFLASASNLSVGNGTLLNAVATTAAKIETSTVTGGADAKPTFQIAGLVGKGLELTSSVIRARKGTMVDASSDGSPSTFTSLQTLVGAGELVYDGGNAGVINTGGNCAHAGSTRVSPFVNLTTIPNSLTTM